MINLSYNARFQTNLATNDHHDLCGLCPEGPRRGCPVYLSFQRLAQGFYHAICV